MATPTWDNTVPSWDETTPTPTATQPQVAKPKVAKEAATPTWDETIPTWEQTTPTTAAPKEVEGPGAYQRAEEIRQTPKGGLLASEKVTDDEIAEIAAQTGTDPEKLKEYVNYFGVFREGEEGPAATGKALLGQAGKLAFGIPQKIMKVAQDDKYEEALDILGALAGQKQSYFLDVAGMLGGPNVAVGRAIRAIAPETGAVTKALAGAGEAIATGATAGVAQSEKGKELEGGLIGAGGGAIISALPATARGIKKFTNWSDKKIQEGLKNIRANSANIEEAYAKSLPERLPELNAKKAASRLNVRDPKEFTQQISDETAKALVGDDAIKKATTEGTAENTLVLQLLGRGERDTVLEAEAAKALAFAKMKATSKELKRTFGESLTQLQKGRTPEDVSKLLDELDKTKFAMQAVAGKGFEKTFNPLERIGYKLMSYLSDSKPFLQILDDRYGTNWELIADNASKKMNLVYGASVRKFAKDISDIATLTKDPARYRQIVDEVESGNPTSPEAQKIKQFFETVLADANEKGANIQQLKGKGYFPKLRKSPVEYIRSYRQEADRLQEVHKIDFSDITDANLTKLMDAHPDIKSFIDETLRVTDLNVPTATNVKQAFMIMNGDIARARQALNLKAFATQQRSKTELPEWAREIDPAKAAQRWVTNTYKFLALKDELAQLNAAEQIAKKANDKVAAEYLRNLRQDWMGGRIDTLASWGKKQAEKWQINMDAAREKALKEGKTTLARWYEGAKDLPDMFTKAQNNVYTNALGLSPKAAVQNLASFYTQNFPELGHATSIYYTGKALPKLGKLIKNGELGDYVYRQGLLDRDWTAEAADVMAGNLRKSFARKMTSKAAEKYANVVMAAFKGSELTARAMTSLIAREIAEDMIPNPELRNKLVSGLKSGAYRRALQNALEKRDVEATKNILTTYMNSNNMYNYNKLNQAEFARSLGPMFSIFSKWPSMAIGVQMKDFLSGGGVTPAAIRSMRLLYLPYVTMYLADAVADRTVKPLVGEQRAEATIGKKGLHGMMLVDATPTGVFERGGILASPAVRAANTVAKSIVSEDQLGERFTTAFKNLASTYVPVLPLVDRVMTRDIPKLIYNEKPERSK